ncbi:ribonuclease Y, partial [Candidatus Sumerlaeota bacterium]|nr:ribonuclease Y [Candidatus Sumerlaeota bacterium]
RKTIEEFEKKAEEEYERRLEKFEREFSKRRHEIERLERRLTDRQTTLERKIEAQDKREKELQAREADIAGIRERIQKKEEAIEAIRIEAKRKCESISGLTEEKAKKMLLENIEADVRQDAAAMVHRVEAETKEIADRKARQIITMAIQRCAAEQVTESTVSVVQLPSDEVKGKIIGREGRNIRALEAATGCNIIVDDTPEAVVLSCFDPIRREIARQTLEKMLGDGRIHPGRIEEVVAKVEKNLQDHIRQVGEQTCFDLGLADMHPELSKVLGRLKYRTSYGQNILNHSIEMAQLCMHMAAELGADMQAAKRAGLLHDIGKALTHEMEGTHALIGADLCKKYNEAPGVVHAIAAHHNEVEPRTIIAVLVQAADSISSARPGARRETLENYVKRLRDIEAIADSFKGVTKAYAIQAGREIRIMVEPTEINDNEASLMARDVSKRIEKELQYPGQNKVTVCRETRFVEYAK